MTDDIAGTPTVAELWNALRLDGTPDEASEAGRRLSWARGMAVERADLQAANAPPGARRMAITLCVGWLYDGPYGIGWNSANAWQRSGAESMLAPWTRRRAGRIGKAD